MSGKVSNSVTVGFLNMQTESLGPHPLEQLHGGQGASGSGQPLEHRGLFVNRQATGAWRAPTTTTGPTRSTGVSGSVRTAPYRGSPRRRRPRSARPGSRLRPRARLQLRGLADPRELHGDGAQLQPGGRVRTSEGLSQGRYRRLLHLPPRERSPAPGAPPPRTFTRFWNLEDSFIESSLVHIDNGWQFNDSSSMFTAWNIRKEGVVRSFTISGIPVSPGMYDWHEFRTAYNTNRSAPFYAGSASSVAASSEAISCPTAHRQGSAPERRSTQSSAGRATTSTSPTERP